MTNQEALTLTIELSPDEASYFIERAHTDDPEFLPGIAKAFVLGVQDATSIKEIEEMLGQLRGMIDLASDESRRPTQDQADAFLFTVQQLASEAARKEIVYWANFSADWHRKLTNDVREAAPTDQVTLAAIAESVGVMRGFLVQALNKVLFGPPHQTKPAP